MNFLELGSQALSSQFPSLLQIRKLKHKEGTVLAKYA